jgi:hypothetical protein
MITLVNQTKPSRPLTLVIDHQSVCCKLGHCHCNANGTPETVFVPAGGRAPRLPDYVAYATDVIKGVLAGTVSAKREPAQNTDEPKSIGDAPKAPAAVRPRTRRGAKE